MYVVCPALVNLADIQYCQYIPYPILFTLRQILFILNISFTIIPHICCKNHRCYIKKFCKHYEKYIPQVGAKIIKCLKLSFWSDLIVVHRVFTSLGIDNIIACRRGTHPAIKKKFCASSFRAFRHALFAVKIVCVAI